MTQLSISVQSFSGLRFAFRDGIQVYFDNVNVIWMSTPIRGSIDPYTQV